MKEIRQSLGVILSSRQGRVRRGNPVMDDTTMSLNKEFGDLSV